MIFTFLSVESNEIENWTSRCGNAQTSSASLASICLFVFAHRTNTHTHAHTKKKRRRIIRCVFSLSDHFNDIIDWIMPRKGSKNDIVSLVRSRLPQFSDLPREKIELALLYYDSDVEMTVQAFQRGKRIIFQVCCFFFNNSSFFFRRCDRCA